MLTSTSIFQLAIFVLGNQHMKMESLHFTYNNIGLKHSLSSKAATSTKKTINCV